MSAEALECPVCLTLPEGEVHQCNEGHCCCAECWNRLEEPRRCPECRQPVAQANRNRAAERCSQVVSGWLVAFLAFRCSQKEKYKTLQR